MIFSDLEKFLTGYIRERLAAYPDQPYEGGFISNEFYKPRPDVPREPPLFQIVVRDDSGPSTSVVTRNSSVGITVLMGDGPSQGEQATDLALLVQAIVSGCPGVEAGNPVAAVRGSNGPYKVAEESGRPRRYMTFELAVAGRAFP